MIKNLKALLLFVVSVSIILVIAETFVRLYIPVRDVGASFTEYDPMYGKSLKKNFTTTRITPEFAMKFSTNSQGFRGPEFDTTASAPILFLGDSFTLGYGVSDGFEFPSIVGKALNPDGEGKWYAINAGIGNSGNGRWIKFLQGPAKKIAPKLVILQVFSNDPRDNMSEGLYKISENGDLVELKLREKPLIHLAREFTEFIPGLSDLYIFGLFRQVALSQTFRPVAQSPKIADKNRLNLTTKLVETSIHICKQNKWPVMLLLAGIPGNDTLSQAIKKIARKENIEAVVVPDKNKRPDLYFAIDGHWNNEGHRFAADLLIQKINKWKSQRFID